jgi:hypothetical protein
LPSSRWIFARSRSIWRRVAMTKMAEPSAQRSAPVASWMSGLM